MQTEGMGTDQVTQVRGFADESPRNAAKPEDPMNRRVTMIIQYLPPPAAADPAPPATPATPGAKPSPAPAAKPAPNQPAKSPAKH